MTDFGTLTISLAAFRQKVWRYYRQHGRVLPWRLTTDPYAILVSEIMLQQTQVERVVPKYEAWMQRFNGWRDLADAPLADVLVYWQGLGYNRRAKYLQLCAQAVLEQYDGVLPHSEDELRSLPGVGSYTAAAVRAFAFNQPSIMIETNIRTAFLYHFFPEQQQVSDTTIVPLITATVSARQPRRWYWALMDYGAFLKKEHGNPNARSKHYVRQSTFSGSNRQARGRIIALLTSRGAVAIEEMMHELQVGEARARTALAQLESEGLVVLSRGRYRIP